MDILCSRIDVSLRRSGGEGLWAVLAALLLAVPQMCVSLFHFLILFLLHMYVQCAFSPFNKGRMSRSRCYSSTRGFVFPSKAVCMRVFLCVCACVYYNFTFSGLHNGLFKAVHTLHMYSSKYTYTIASSHTCTLITPTLPSRYLPYASDRARQLRCWAGRLSWWQRAAFGALQDWGRSVHRPPAEEAADGTTTDDSRGRLSCVCTFVHTCV